MRLIHTGWFVASWLIACGDDGGSGDSETSGGAGTEGSTMMSTTMTSSSDATSNDTTSTDATTSTGSASTGSDSSSTTSAGACGEQREPEAWPTSGLLIEFAAVSEHAHVYVENAETIAYVDAWLVKPDVPIGIPGGPTELDGTFNPGYSYRLVPSEVTFASVWIEVCDATPCFIEDDPQAWFDNPNDWCPWAFELGTIYDCRDGDGTACTVAYP